MTRNPVGNNILPVVQVDDELYLAMTTTAKKYGMSMPDYRRWCYEKGHKVLQFLNSMDYPPKPIQNENNKK